MLNAIKLTCVISVNVNHLLVSSSQLVRYPSF
ncbi:hypothetical protein [Escherichia phage IMM-001]|nr:hypothetical protein [Escherichia phage IMM-001]